MPLPFIGKTSDPAGFTFRINRAKQGKKKALISQENFFKKRLCEYF